MIRGGENMITEIQGSLPETAPSHSQTSVEH
jgi:hypothetical protein